MAIVLDEYDRRLSLHDELIDRMKNLDEVDKIRFKQQARDRTYRPVEKNPEPPKKPIPQKLSKTDFGDVWLPAPSPTPSEALKVPLNPSEGYSEIATTPQVESGAKNPAPVEIRVVEKIVEVEKVVTVVKEVVKERVNFMLFGYDIDKDSFSLLEIFDAQRGGVILDRKMEPTNLWKRFQNNQRIRKLRSVLKPQDFLDYIRFDSMSFDAGYHKQVQCVYQASTRSSFRSVGVPADEVLAFWICLKVPDGTPLEHDMSEILTSLV